MPVRLFVGNLSPRTTEEALERFFSREASVSSVKIPQDRQTGQTRGFGFVELVSDDAARQALRVLNGQELDGRRLRLGWARAREHREERADRQPRKSARPGASIGPDPGDGEEAWSRFDSREVDDYRSGRTSRPRRGGKHGSDRRRGRGTRRTIE